MSHSGHASGTALRPPVQKREPGPTAQSSPRVAQLKRDLRGLDFEAGDAALAPSAQVQRSGAAEAGADIHGHAAAGIRGGGGALPFADKIQKSFGRHDVSGIQAHQGAGAAEAAKNMGAEAYATGRHVVFGGAPSLHTAAHEAAHVVQQRGGVSLKGGVGQVGDAYERHADAVADAVVAGRSAEGLLDSAPGGGGGGTGVGAEMGPVQRKIGFEFETDALVRRAKGKDGVKRDGTGGEPLNKMDSLTGKSAGLDMQVDTNPINGSVIEFVSDPFDVTKKGRVDMEGALQQLTTWSRNVESIASGEDVKTMDYKPLSKYVGGDESVYARPQFRTLAGNPQVSAGLDLEELHGVLSDWSESGEKNSKAPAIVKPLFQKIGESPGAYRAMATELRKTKVPGDLQGIDAPTSGKTSREDRAGRRRVLDVLGKSRGLGRFGEEHQASKSLQSLVWLVGSYIKTVHLDTQTKRGKPFTNSKELSVLMSRNNFGSLFAELPEEERNVLRLQPQLLVDIVGSASGTPMDEKVYPFGFLKGANKQTVAFGLTRAEWVRGITQGKDLLTKDYWVSMEDNEVEGIGDHREGGTQVHKSLGGYKNKDTDRGYEQAIFEFRKIPGGLSADKFAEQMRKTWDYLESKMKQPKENK